MHKRGFLIGVLTCLLYATGFSQAIAPVTYRNPVIAGDFADPSVIRVGDTFYAAGTSSEWGPAYPLYSSKDLVNWHYVGPVFKDLPGWTMGSYWAPELFYRQGTFYVYYTARRKSDKRSYIGVASTRDIRKGFTDHGCLLEWTSEAIDAFVVEDGGKLYITWKAYGLDPDKPIQILGRELSPDGLKVTGEVFTLLEAERDSWEAGGMEGQALFRRGDYFYLTYSGNACCGTGCNYQVGLARTRNLQGPWEKFAGNPVLRGNQDWKCPGHGTVVVTDDNRYFYLYHAYNGTSFTFTGREGLLSELVWDEQTGWPAFRDGSTPPVEAASPFGVPHKPDLHLTAEFNRREEPLPWVWDVSQPAPAFTVEKGYLRLETAKNSPPAGNFLGLVVKKGDYVFSATILPQDKVLQSICVYGDADNAMGAGLRKDSLEIWQVKKGERQVLQKHPLPKSSALVMLHLRSRAGRFYEFTWELPDGTRGTTGQEPLDGVFLPPWDRAPRVGISVRGEGKAKGMVDAVRLEYK